MSYSYAHYIRGTWFILIDNSGRWLELMSRFLCEDLKGWKIVEKSLPRTDLRLPKPNGRTSICQGV